MSERNEVKTSTVQEFVGLEQSSIFSIFKNIS